MDGSYRHVAIRALALLSTFASWAVAAPAGEVFEVRIEDCGELPRGKEADGVAGDFILRNEHIEAVIGGNLPGRKANMGTNWDAPTPGALYDLCVRSSGNDQLTYLGPGGLEGEVSSVRTIPPDENPFGVGIVRVERTVARGRGRAVRHDWFIPAGASFLAAVSTYRNEAAEDWDLDPRPSWKEFSDRRTVRGILTGDATNPTDRQGYACATTAFEGELRLGEPAVRRTLRMGEEASYLTVIAPALSPAAAFGTIAALAGPTGSLSIALHTGDEPVRSARIEVLGLEKETPLSAYPDERGVANFALPPGRYTLRTRDLGRPSVENAVDVVAGETQAVDLALAPASHVVVHVTERGESIPCKVRFIGEGTTPDPWFGVDIQAHGCRNVYMSESGSFVQAVDPGEYRLVITRGIEYDHAHRSIRVRPGETVRVEAELRRIVATPGWVSTDFHNHSTPSGDNYCGTDDRVINLAVEQVEFAPTTEHNRFYDWTPHIERLGLERELRTVVGVELTGPVAHFNAFPFELVPYTQDNGAPLWQRDPRIDAILLRDYQNGGANRWVQINHPHVGKFFRDRDADGRADGGYSGLDLLIDAAEVWSLDILHQQPTISYTRENKELERENRTFAWLQLLNQGVRMNCVAVSDAHAVFGNAVGGWRTYVRSSEDRPERLSPDEIIRNAKAGRMFVTTGPYLEVELEDGTGIGGETVLRGPFTMHVRVQCTDWIDIDRVAVLINGRIDPTLDFAKNARPELFHAGGVKFDEKLRIDLPEDGQLIVVAAGEGSRLREGYGDSNAGTWFPCAFTNPIRVDIDGHGFRPNGDTLGHPLPIGKP